MKFSRCIQTMTACTGLVVGLVLAAPQYAAANCGDGVSGQTGEQCDNGTPVCGTSVNGLKAKNAGAQCHKVSDCTGVLPNTIPGSDDDMCGCGAGNPGESCVGTTVGNRDDIPADDATACRSNCMPPMCGDGVSDFNEQCDDGAKNGPNHFCLGGSAMNNTVCQNSDTGVIPENPKIPGSGATIACKTDIDCQASISNPGLAALQPLKCTGNPQCLLNVCGDKNVCSDSSCPGVRLDVGAAITTKQLVLGPEQCDDGNTSSTDACSAPGERLHGYLGDLENNAGDPIPYACALAFCGDGLTAITQGEACDAGIGICVTGVNGLIDSGGGIPLDINAVKTCNSDADCTVNGVPGICSGSDTVGSGSTTLFGPYAGSNSTKSDSKCVGGATPGAACDPADSICGTGTCTSVCRPNCQLPSCGDGVSDTGLGEECDDGNTFNGPGDFCLSDRRCIGGLNGCAPDATDENVCATEAGRKAATPCTTDSQCVKGKCGSPVCRQNTCGDQILAGKEECDDGNTVSADDTAYPTDTCGISDDANSPKKPAFCDSTKMDQNDPKACVEADCRLPFCGDGVTNPGEMCDSGQAICQTGAINAGAKCSKRSDCKNPAGNTDDLCGCSDVGSIVANCVAGTQGNRDNVANQCRSACMPASCGDGVSDSGESCDLGSGNGDGKPCLGSAPNSVCADTTTHALTPGSLSNGHPVGATIPCKSDGDCPSGSSCTGNPACTPNVCGDGRACKDATCKSGPTCNQVTGQCDTDIAAGTAGTAGPEQCDDANTVTPSTSNLDTCSTVCSVGQCGDGITQSGEQCDANAMGCSNMNEDLTFPEMAPTCCLDGNVVNGNKAGPGLLTIEQAFHALIDCRLPSLTSAAACNKLLSRQYTRIQNRVNLAQVVFENNDITRARRILNMTWRNLERMSNRIAWATKPGKSCAGGTTAASLTNQTGNAANLTVGIVAVLTEDNASGGFGQ